MVTLLSVSAIFSALAAGPLAIPANAGAPSCSIPVGEGVVTPSGGNTAHIDTITTFAAQVSCAALDLENYTATLQVWVERNGGPTQCAYRSVTESSTVGQDLTLRVTGTCTTLASDPAVNQTQYIAVRVTTSNGVDSGYKFYDIV